MCGDLIAQPPLPAGSGVVGALTEEELVALFSQPTPRERFRMHTAKAARLEREGDYAVAMRHWLTAAELAPQSLDCHWCGCRAQWCERQVDRPDSGGA